MKIITPIAWLAGTAALLAVSAAQNNMGLGMLSFLTGGIGLGTLFPALKERWSSRGHELPPGTLQELEQRLKVTEEELAAATRELLALREQHDFDLRLQLSKVQPQSQGSLPNPVTPGASNPSA